MHLLRVKFHDIDNFNQLDITSALNFDNELKVYKEVLNVLATRLYKDFPTDRNQDQKELERRSTLKDPIKFKSIGYRILEKNLLDYAIRRADFRKQSLLEETIHRSENKQQRDKLDNVINSKELI